MSTNTLRQSITSAGMKIEKLVVCRSPKRANWQHKRNTDTFAKKRKKIRTANAQTGK